jgi:hypothetical protein
VCITTLSEAQLVPYAATNVYRRRAAGSQVSRPNSTRAAGAGGSSNTMLKLYTDDSPGLRVYVSSALQLFHINYCLQRSIYRPCPLPLVHWFNLFPTHLRQNHPRFYEVICRVEQLLLFISMFRDWSSYCRGHFGQHGIWIRRCIKSRVSVGDNIRYFIPYSFIFSQRLDVKVVNRDTTGRFLCDQQEPPMPVNTRLCFAIGGSCGVF